MMTPDDASSAKLVFISDVHLGGFDTDSNQKIEQSLIRFIDYCDEHQYQIHILGDLFDYWMEYPNRNPPVGSRALERFRVFNRDNRPILYITGNHDNWTRGYFSELGFDVEPEYRIQTIDGAKALLLHGDGVNDPELGLPRDRMHRLLRNPTFIRAYQKILPPGIGLKVMRLFSKVNRKFGEEAESRKPLNKWAVKVLKKLDIDYILCGHDHEPRHLNFNFGTYINLGTFYKHRTVVTYNNREFRLVVWDETSGTLFPFDSQFQSNE